MRCHIARFRIHHGFVGSLLVAVGIVALLLGGWAWFAGVLLAWIGAVLCWDDRRDFRHWWPSRED